MKQRRMTLGASAMAYQIAGHLLLTDPDDRYGPASLTKGQRARLTELLLNHLSEPGKYRAKVLSNLYRLALEP